MERLQQAHKDGVVLGLSGINGSEPVERLDIDVLLLNHPDTFNLLLIAFKELKGEPVPWGKEIDEGYRASNAEKMYWYQVAGIHGLPSALWEGEKDKNWSKENSFGYCAHATPLFSTWHRPYLAMLEQSLYRQASNVVERFERSATVSKEYKQRYRDALKQLRLPYWDYFRPRAVNPQHQPFDFHVPWIFTVPQVMIRTLPNNELESLDNPFFNYNFGENDLTKADWDKGGLTARYDDHKKTIRWGGNGEGHHENMNKMVNMIREDNMRMVSLMIGDERAEGYPNFEVYSTVGVSGNKPEDLIRNFPRFGSLEATHGTYHVYVGGFLEAFTGDPFLRDGPNNLAGHLICVPLSAFDPIFWFHHCQIDRLFAIWQAANPTQDGVKPSHWFEDLTDAKWAGIDKEPLYPFRKTVSPKKTYWNSNDSRYTKAFGYTYPDTEEGKSAKQIRAAFKDRYDWSVSKPPSWHYEPCPEDMLPLDLSQAQVYRYTAATPLYDQVQRAVAAGAFKVVEAIESFQAAFQADEVSEFAYDWFIDVVIERMALNNSFTIFFVLGDIAGKAGASWASNPGFAGVAHIFTSPREICANCNDQADENALITETVPITTALIRCIQKGELASLEKKDVEPFLKERLKWRVQAVDGRVVNPRVLTESHNFQLGISVRTSPLRGQNVEAYGEPLPSIIEEIIMNAS